MIWIRSQDKTRLIKCDFLDIYELNERRCCIKEHGMYVLGTYSTKEKALKVLNMIQKRICFISLAERETLGCSERWFPSEDYVFQMPLDLEVK